VHDLGEAPRPFLYLPFGRQSAARYLSQVTLAARAPISLVEKALHQAAPDVPVYGGETLEHRLSSLLAPQLVALWLLGLFGLLALVVAAVGIHGAVAFNMSQRTREIGIRMALGATREQVTRLVLLQSLLRVAVGLAAGSGLAFAATRIVAGFLYGVSPTDAATFLVTAALLAGVALLAAWFPVRRAVREDPAVTLRAD
jgi:predicted lysophospholipase L1 biosynthesis ABC-type transport system permease subunit